ncbi:MAG TPA: hypothetical protein VJT82_00365 [Pyrinomonadaceae bacterium]|nr:hypothetical protein [Pyrinomonadaceae bacterium]
MLYQENNGQGQALPLQLFPLRALQLDDIRAELIPRPMCAGEGVGECGAPGQPPLVQVPHVLTERGGHQPADQLNQRVPQVAVVVADEDIN